MYHEYPEVQMPTGSPSDKDENVWFTEFFEDGKIGKVDAKTGKLIKYTQPTPESWPRRLKIDARDIVWFCEYEAAKSAASILRPKHSRIRAFRRRPTPTPHDRQEHRARLVLVDGNGHHLRNGPRNGQDHAVPVLFSENGMRISSGCRWPHVVRLSGEQSSWLLLPCWVGYKSARCGRTFRRAGSDR